MVAMLYSIDCDPLDMVNHAEGIALDKGLTLPPAHDAEDIDALAQLATTKWLDMAIVAKMSGAARTLDSVSQAGVA